MGMNYGDTAGASIGFGAAAAGRVVYTDTVGNLATASTLTYDGSLLTLSRLAIATAQTVAQSIANSTAAAAGAQQYSPVLELAGNGWKTDATAASQAVAWGFQARPVQGAAAPTSVLDFLSSIAGAAYAAKATLTSGGLLSVNSHRPLTDGSGSVGATSFGWTGMFLASGGIISFNNSDVVLTHSANKLAFDGATTGYVFDTMIGIGIDPTQLIDMKSANPAIRMVKTGILSWYIGNFVSNNMSIYSDGGADNTAFNITAVGTVILGATSAGANAGKGVLALSNTATAPTGSADLAHLYSADCAGAGTAALCIYQEDGVRTAAAVLSTNSIPCMFNGTTYYLLCTTVRS